MRDRLTYLEVFCYNLPAFRPTVLVGILVCLVFVF